jgi:hypothetical protein
MAKGNNMPLQPGQPVYRKWDALFRLFPKATPRLLRNYLHTGKMLTYGSKDGKTYYSTQQLAALLDKEPDLKPTKLNF